MIWFAAAGLILLVAVAAVGLPLTLASTRRRRQRQARETQRSIERAVRRLYGDHSLSVQVIRWP